jgi:NAD-dependent SIR2 family protein deacetylase
MASARRPSYKENVDAAANLDALVRLARGGRVTTLTGAGVSTESGIPDYRSPGAPKTKPVMGPEFARSAKLRQRYWARAMAGWDRFSSAAPNRSHQALAELEHRDSIHVLITQNVDGLHQAAGSVKVVELHGALASVCCLACGAVEPRTQVQARMHASNPDWPSALSTMAPDGDAELATELIARFVAPTCGACGGPLKPKVVFFGDNVAREIVDHAYAEVESAQLLLVAGTSLTVFSGYRFLRRAAERKIPIAIVNRGAVRGEEHAALKIEASTGATLAALEQRLRS